MQLECRQIGAVRATNASVKTSMLTWCRRAVGSSAGVSKSALCEVVEAHKALAAQEARLQLLIEHLSDKDALLEQARQLVS